MSTTGQASRVLWERRAWLVVALMLVAGLAATPTVAADKEKKARLESTLSQILRGKTAETRVTLGKPVSYVAAVVKKQVTRMVCTDVQVDSGEIAYVMPWHAVPVMAKEVVPKASLASYVEPGAAMRVEQVDVVRTRVQLHLREVSTGHQSLIRLWFSKGFASRLGPREVLQPLAGLLAFDGVLGELLAEARDSRAFPDRVAEVQRAHEVGGRDPAARLETGAAYLTVLEEEIGRREAWAEITGTSPETADLEPALQGLAQEVGLLVEQVHGPRLAELRQELEGVSAEISSLRGAGAGGEGSTEEDLAKWRVQIEAWQQVVDEYSALRGPGWDAEQAALQQGLAEFRKAERGSILDAEEAAAVAARAAGEAMGETPATSLGAFNAQKGSLDRFRKLIEQRQALLAKLDPPAPAAVQARLNADEGRLSGFESLVAQSEEALRPAVLAQQYASMRRKRNQLYDSYTLAFGGPDHRKAGRALINYLDQMIANRREAAGLGDSNAGSQVSELQRSRRQIQSQTP